MINERSSERLKLLLEPEGACLSVMADHPGMTAGSTVMVLDCGGGTVDVTVHKLRSIEPLRLDEVVIPSGGNWGSTYVDASFVSFIQELVGEERFAVLKTSLAYLNMMVRHAAAGLDQPFWTR
jgi:molecular chaperone DnaK (HSP70)